MWGAALALAHLRSRTGGRSTLLIVLHTGNYTEKYWSLLEQIQTRLVPVLEPILARMNFSNIDNHHVEKLKSIKSHILPRLKVVLLPFL